ncbi:MULTISPECIES: hypothetical protein [unclassified Paludibacterium]|uniref:hypothetical protein n=1 Tax=unclassified Paludibacterium TaxID=2618429 RepID=UPI001C047547|nr:hypothetical protein [Paludibacterium sp. B53371]
MSLLRRKHASFSINRQNAMPTLAIYVNRLVKIHRLISKNQETILLSLHFYGNITNENKNIAMMQNPIEASNEWDITKKHNVVGLLKFADKEIFS